MSKSPSFAEKVSAPRQLLERAMEFLRRGQLAEAEVLYRQILEAQPDHFEAQHLLGVLRAQQGRYGEALELVGAALRTKSDSVGALTNCGLILHRMQRHAEALASFERALALRPDHAGALNNRGNVLAELGRHEEALTSYEQALAIRPDYAEALYHRGNVLARLERYQEALASYDKVIAVRPDHAEAFDNRGNALSALKRHEEALASFQQALAIKPDYAGALNNRGIAFEQLRQYQEALASYDSALVLQPDHAEALGNRGNVLLQLQRYEEALAAYDRALAIKSDDVDTLYSRGNALSALRRYELAAESYGRALAISPGDGNALAGLANAALAICDWRRAGELGARLAAHIDSDESTIGPFALLRHCDDPSVLFRCASNFVARQAPALRPPAPGSDVGRRRIRHEKIRIAYLSADFRSHVMGQQLAELFERHDRTRFEVLGVAFSGDDGSDIRRRLLKGFDRFLDVTTTSDRESARLLNAHQVDIAVDLMGHTRDARIGILAQRPAPIQVNYLGYAGTTGADFIDYIMGDAVVLPFEQQPFYTENIVQLPETFFVNDSKRPISARVPTRREAGLPEQGFVFCCFNNPAKIQPALFDVWMRLLGAVEGSVLWLSARNSGAERNLRREAQLRGLDPSRLVFAERVAQMEDHLARHRLADLFLDTSPYNAHATASDALWAGLPVLTCLGESFAARVGASLLQAVGLPDLVTHSLADYQALALRLATDPSLHGAVRRTLEQNRQSHPLFNTERLCRHIEAAYTTMWDIWQRHEPPKGFRVRAIEASGR